jgi:hypothetical protein
MLGVHRHLVGLESAGILVWYGKMMSVVTIGPLMCYLAEKGQRGAERDT